MVQRPWHWCLALSFIACSLVTTAGTQEDEDAFGLEASESEGLLFSSAQGTVLDEMSQPLPDAVVTLTPPGGKGKLLTDKTDKKGRWRLGQLEPGAYKITIEATGYIQASGTIQVLQPGRTPPLKVELQSLAVVLPAGVESNPKVVYQWLDRGNSLLAQGRPAEARAEYEKAVEQLGGEDQAEVLRSIARTHYLEGKLEETIRALKRSLVAAPRNTESRGLLEALLAGAQRAAEGEAWLARLEREGAEALRVELEPPDEDVEPSFALPASGPVERAVAHRVGAFRTSFSESSPLSSIEVFSQRFGIRAEDIAAGDPSAGRYRLAEETFEVLVPETYRAERPAGLIVWVSPTRSGLAWHADLPAALAERNLIWVGANRSGNGRPRWTRMGLALDAAEAMRRLYSIDSERVYVAGYSGGGRVSSAVAMVYHEVFQGALCIMGMDYFRAIPVSDRPGTHWPATYPAPARDVEKELKTRRRWVLLTGERDFNRAQSKAFAAELRKDGFRHVTYLEMPGISHYDEPPPGWLGRAFDALDASLGGERGRGPG